MTRQEEYEMILKIRNKEIDFECIVQQYEKLLWRKVHQYSIVGQEDEDKYSCALYALHKAVSTFDNRSKFSNYLGHIIDNDFLSLIRKAQGERNGDVNYVGCVRLNKVINPDGEQEAELGSVIPCDALREEVKCNTIKQMLYSFVDSLSESDKEILELYLFHNVKQSDIAKQIGATQSCVSRRINKMLLSFKQQLLDNGLLQ